MSGADLAGPIADEAIVDLRAAQDALERDLFRILLQLDTQPGEDSLVRRQGQTAAAVYRQIADRLAQAGEDAISVAGQRALAAVEAVVGAAPATLPLDVRAELDQIVERQAADVVRVFRGAEQEMRAAVARGVLSGGSLGDIVADVSVKMDTTYRQAQAAVDAAIMAVGRRAVMAEAQIAADEGIDLVYVYVGPRDGKNRPFCKTWVGKAVTQPSGMDNGQGLDVADYCGGYNCRHSWAPTPTDEALRLGYRIFDTSANGQGDDITDRLRQQMEVAQ